jgi:hypothetical protein
VSESAGGALSDQATLLAPDGPAFSIWTPIYVGLAAYTVWQWLPAQGAAHRQRAVGWYAAASMVLNATWLLVVQQGWLWMSVGVIAALAAVLGLLVQRLTDLPAAGVTDRLVTDGTFGLYLGWVCVAVPANVAAAAVDSGVTLGRLTAEVVAVGVLAVVAALSVFLAFRLGARMAVAVALAWGLAWVAVGRVTGSPESAVVAVAAVTAAAIAICAVPAARSAGVRAAA